MSEENNINQHNPQNQHPDNLEDNPADNWAPGNLASQIPGSTESRLQDRANELIAQRIGPLKTEIERLEQAVIETIAAVREDDQKEYLGLLKQAAKNWDRAQQRANEAAVEKELKERLKQAAKDWDRAQQRANAAVEEELKERLKQAAKDWDRAQQRTNEVAAQKRFEQLRNDVVAATRQEAEEEFKEQLKQAARDWKDADQMAEEATFQKRLEQACTEAAAVARRESEVQIEDLREQLEASRKALTLAVSSAQPSSAQSSSFDLVRAAVDEIDSQRTQSETLTSLVRRAAQFAPRVVFFVVKGGDALGWRANGFENGLNDETVRQLTVPAQNTSLLQEALANFRTAVGRSSSPGENSAVLGLYGSPAPERAIAVPLVVRGKAAAVLYADSGTHSENAINIPAIETLMRVASMVIELLPARRGFEPSRPSVPASAIAAPASTPARSSRPSPATPPVSEQPSVKEQLKAVPEPVRPVSEVPQPTESTPEAPPEWTEHVRTTEELIKPRAVVESWKEDEAPTRKSGKLEAAPEAKNRVETPAPREFISTESLEARESWQAETPPVSGDSQPGDAESASAPTVLIGTQRQTLDIPREEEKADTWRQSDEEPPADSAFAKTSRSELTVAPEPPRPPQIPVSVPTPASETEQRAHNDARRFARLLVSEIKLYNAAKVNEGRRNFDLYERLRDEIDRSRKVYDKRVSPAVASRFDYFYDELVQTLAEGDPAKLGPSCPGPVVLAS
ncbi:MAG: hypothetical protein L0226_16770 [Acidobacteria bacterium]|nr:hypothetical protein [Acidobacteriota bacterium]